MRRHQCWIFLAAQRRRCAACQASSKRKNKKHWMVRKALEYASMERRSIERRSFEMQYRVDDCGRMQGCLAVDPWF